MNFMNLIEFIITGKEWEEGENFKHDTSDTPEVHLVAVVAVCKQALRSSVPPGGDVFGVRLFRVDASAGPEIGQLHDVILEQDVLWLDISVKDAVAVHMID